MLLSDVLENEGCKCTTWAKKEAKCVFSIVSVPLAPPENQSQSESVRADPGQPMWVRLKARF